MNDPIERSVFEEPLPVAPQETVSQLLLAWSDGDSDALDRLLPLVEPELRRVAKHHMRQENPGHTLQTTALVNEVYLKLVTQKRAQWQNRAHFFAVAARFMRRILIDHARHNLRNKRGGGAVAVGIDEAMVVSHERSEELLALDEGLNRLAQLDPLKAKIVEFRHFGGLSVEEVAEVLKIAPITVIRHWGLAKSWLRREIHGR
jgi:RNA polymerase sigma factor (TIGR02999 family)